MTVEPTPYVPTEPIHETAVEPTDNTKSEEPTELDNVGPIKKKLKNGMSIITPVTLKRLSQTGSTNNTNMFSRMHSLFT